AADGTPDLVAQDSLFSGPVGLAGHGPRPVRVFPNPSRDGSVFVQLPDGQVPDGVQGFDASGRTVPLRVERLGDRLRVTLPDQAGTYLLVVERQGQRWLERVVRW
ncbi:MAG: T9SS type A sorting domain-containing protein, partial [Flavobacteriales bacterium]|nr:T9SS type A sorting domain-containing protein [Flavobacteriales bacterium]